jgi:hypothetical protein
VDEEAEMGWWCSWDGCVDALCTAAARVTGSVVARGLSRRVCFAGVDASEESDGLEKEELCLLDGARGVLEMEALMSRVSPPGRERSNSDCSCMRSCAIWRSRRAGVPK